jgi:hypothetical protein
MALSDAPFSVSAFAKENPRCKHFRELPSSLLIIHCYFHAWNADFPNKRQQTLSKFPSYAM